MTNIEWVARPGTIPVTWNPVTGCTKISDGCRNCYAERMARRLAGRCGYPEAPHHFDVTLHHERLGQLLRWKKPRTVFVCSMSDLFHEDIPDWFILKVWDVMRRAPQHTFLVLTKRPRRMQEVVGRICDGWCPLPNAWLGVTVENQRTADERIPLLLQTPAAVHFVSCEPLLEEINIREYLHVDGCHTFEGGESFPNLCLACGGKGTPSLDWVIAGCESGPHRRHVDTSAFRFLRDQCQDAVVPFFLKQMEVDGKVVKMPELDGRMWREWPR